MPEMSDHQRVVEGIRAKVREVGPGGRLPSRAQLAAEFEVSLSTVARAVLVLQAMGEVIGHQGKALFAPGDKPPG